jgi:hypothetical protein
VTVDTFAVGVDTSSDRINAHRPTGGLEPSADGALRMAVLDRLVSLHEAPAKALVHTLADGFEIPGRDQSATDLANISKRWDAGPFAESTRRWLARQAGSINERLARYDRVVGDTADRSGRRVVTHG